MWIVELNFLGRRFTREVHGPRRPFFAGAPRHLNWRSPQLRGPRAA